MKTASQFLGYVSIWFGVGWLSGWLETQIRHNPNFMSILNYFISESYFFYPMMGLFGVVIILIFSQIKIKKRMNAIVELTSKIADENVTAEQATALVAQAVIAQVTAQIQPILEMINQNSTEDGLTRDQVNEVTQKINETLNVIGSNAPVVAPPVDEVPPVIVPPVEETPVPEDPAPVTDPVVETPAPEEPVTPTTDVPETDPVK